MRIIGLLSWFDERPKTMTEAWKELADAAQPLWAPLVRLFFVVWACGVVAWVIVQVIA